MSVFCPICDKRVEDLDDPDNLKCTDCGHWWALPK